MKTGAVFGRKGYMSIKVWFKPIFSSFKLDYFVKSLIPLADFARPTHYYKPNYTNSSIVTQNLANFRPSYEYFFYNLLS